MGTTFKFEDKLNILGKTIKNYRESKNISIDSVSRELALLGINMPTDSLYQIENNTRSIKDYELAGISSILGFSVDEEFKKFINQLK